MRKIDDGERKKKKKKKIMVEIVATTSLPVDRLMATDCNTAARANFKEFNLGGRSINTFSIIATFYQNSQSTIVHDSAGVNVHLLYHS